MVAIETIVGIGIAVIGIGLFLYKKRDNLKNMFASVDVADTAEIYNAVVEFASGGDDGVIDPEDAVKLVERLIASLSDEVE